MAKVGLILGGGGEVGVAWETAVLVALEEHAGFVARDVEVVTGTSAGAIVAGYLGTGRDLGDVLDGYRAGRGIGLTEAVDGDSSSNVLVDAIDPRILELFMSASGSIEEVSAAVGTAALEVTPRFDEATFRARTGRMLGGNMDWPDLDIRPTAVEAETGRTVLWNRTSGIDLISATASSCAVPSIFPLVEFNGRHYMDSPRTSFSAQLVEEKDLDAVVFIGLVLPLLANTTEAEALKRLSRDMGTKVVLITGGPGMAELEGDYLDVRAAERAIAPGLADGKAAAAEVAAIL